MGRVGAHERLRKDEGPRPSHPTPGRHERTEAKAAGHAFFRPRRTVDPVRCTEPPVDDDRRVDGQRRLGQSAP